MGNNNNMYNFGGSNISINFNGNQNGQIGKFILLLNKIFNYRSSKYNEFNKFIHIRNEYKFR